MTPGQIALAITIGRVLASVSLTGVGAWYTTGDWKAGLAASLAHVVGMLQAKPQDTASPK